MPTAKEFFTTVGAPMIDALAQHITAARAIDTTVGAPIARMERTAYLAACETLLDCVALCDDADDIMALACAMSPVLIDQYSRGATERHELPIVLEVIHRAVGGIASAPLASIMDRCYDRI